MQNLIVNNFTKGYDDFIAALESQFNQFYGEESLFFTCEDKCCENWLKRPFYNALMTAGYFIHGSIYIGLGTFLSNFANLTAKEVDSGQLWSTFDLNQKIFAANKEEYCQKMSDTDKFLNDYFMDLANAIGFERNHSLSLFDLPSILSSSFDSKVNVGYRMTKDVFPYSQCQMGTMSSKSFHKCYKDSGFVIFSKDI